jgi:hypothetical protein
MSLLLALFMCFFLAISAQTIQNPGAETGSVSSWTASTWTVINNSPVVHSGTYGFYTACSSSCTPLSQSISGFATGSFYQFSLWLRFTNNAQFSASIGGNTIISVTSGAIPYSYFHAIFQATSTSMTLSVTGTNSGGEIDMDDMLISDPPPTASPTFSPTVFPTYNPTDNPTAFPTYDPTHNPTFCPTAFPTCNPTYNPTVSPTWNPTVFPTCCPTYIPTAFPTWNPSASPTYDPTYNPTVSPTSHTIHLLLPHTIRLTIQLFLQHGIQLLLPHTIRLAIQLTIQLFLQH